MSGFFDRVFVCSLGAMLVYVLALPPFHLGPLVFFVPVFWAGIIKYYPKPEKRARENSFSRRMKIRFRSAPFKIWLAALFFWLATTWWICYPHLLTAIGWVILSSYLALYWPVFISITVRAVRGGVPIYIAAPFAWCGLEWFRKTLLSGFSFCSLEHALYQMPELIQTASIWGEYGVGFLIVMFGSAMAEQLIDPSNRRADKQENAANITLRRNIAANSVGIFALLFLLYGNTVVEFARGQKSTPDNDRPLLRAAVLQGNYLVSIDPPDPDHYLKTFQQYCDLSQAAAEKEGKSLDLILWPETVCLIPYITYPEGKIDPIWFDSAEVKNETEFIEAVEHNNRRLLYYALEWKTPVLFGCSRVDFVPGKPYPDRYNSAVFVDPNSKSVMEAVRSGGELHYPHYEKMHLVMFGEYIPFSGMLPENMPFRTLCPEAARGEAPVLFRLKNGTGVMPNICFESSVPTLIRRQCDYDAGEPDVLVNLSNDGWFKFSMQIDLHLATHIFRAVENRKPYLFATNGGFSGWIDAEGKIVRKGGREEAEYVISDPKPGPVGKSLYRICGDWLPMLSIAATALMLMLAQKTGKPEKAS